LFATPSDCASRSSSKRSVPGRRRVEIRSGFGADEQTFAFDGVEVVVGAVTRDPRLQGIDLSRPMRSFIVTITDADGHPIANAALWSKPTRTDERWKLEGRTAGDGKVALTAPVGVFAWGGFDLLVTANGRTPAEVLDVSKDATVVVPSAATSTVIVRLSSNTPRAGARSRIVARLRWAADAVAPIGLAQFWQVDPRDKPSQVFDADRIVRFAACVPGSYRVEVLVTTELGSGASFGAVRTAPETVTVVVRGDGEPVETMVGVDERDAARLTDESK
jgi:hypothetical protein